MKKIILLLFFLLLSTSSVLFPTPVEAGICSLIPMKITTSPLSNNPIPANTNITFNVSNFETPASIRNYTLYIGIDASLSTGYAPYWVSVHLDANGVGSATLPNGLSTNGSHTVSLFSIQSDTTTVCPLNQPVSIFITGGSVVPSPLPGCKNIGDTCAGSEPLCYPLISFCDPTVGGGTVVQRTGGDGGGCLVRSNGEFYCNGSNLWPYVDASNICRCLVSNNSPVFCDENGNPSPRIDLNYRRLTTAIGCIAYDAPVTVTRSLLVWGIGVTGGLGFGVILAGIIMITISKGDPRKVKAGQEMVFSGISGIIMVTLAVFLLEVIGVRILQVLAP